MRLFDGSSYIQDGGEASETSSLVGTGPGGISDIGCSEADFSITSRGSGKGSAPSTPPQVMQRANRSVLRAISGDRRGDGSEGVIMAPPVTIARMSSCFFNCCQPQEQICEMLYRPCQLERLPVVFACPLATGEERSQLDGTRLV